MLVFNSGHPEPGATPSSFHKRRFTAETVRRFRRVTQRMKCGTKRHMGVIGPALFSDDTALDVRNRYLDFLGEGLEGSRATDLIQAEWEDALIDPETAAVFWLALAATQSNYGRLEERVKAKALHVIDTGTDLLRWQDKPSLLVRRRTVLDRLRAQLEGPQRKPRRVVKRYRAECDWAVGEVIAYRLRSGDLVLMRVIGHHVDQGGISPRCELLDWIGREFPSGAELEGVGIRRGFGPWYATTFILCRLKESDLPINRVHRLGIVLAPAQTSSGGWGFLWKKIDQKLEEMFGLA